MNKYCFLLVFVFNVLFVSAQTQNGVVKTKGRLANNGSVIHGVPLSGATVTVKGRNAVVSGNNGKFSLSIPGNNYYLQSVQKQGYVLTDPDVLSKQYVQSKNQLTLVMETPDDQLEDRLDVMNQIRNTLQNQLNKSRAEIKSLKEQNKLTQEEYRMKLQELAAQQESNIQLVNEMADRYSRMDFDQIDDFNRRISKLILEGKLMEADSLLNTKGDINTRAAVLRQHQEANSKAEQELKMKQKKLEKSKAMTKKELEDLAQDCYRKYEIFKMRHENDSAGFYIEYRANLDSTNVEWQLNSADFLMNIKVDLERAEFIYLCALNYSRNNQEKEWEANCLNDLGTLYSRKGDFKKALNYVLQSKDIHVALYGETHMSCSENYSNLGYLYANMGDLSKAEDCTRKALQIALSIEGENNVNTATAYNSLGMINYMRGNLMVALEYLEKANDILFKVAGDNKIIIASTCENIGSVQMRLENFDDSSKMMEKALAMRKEVFGDEHPFIGISYLNIGGLYNEQKNYSKAFEYFSMAKDIFVKFYGEKHVDVALCFNNMGNCLSKMKEFERALPMLKEGLAIRLAQQEENGNLNFATIYNNIGYVLDGMSRYSEAISYYEKALVIRLAVLGETNSLVASTYYNIGNSYESLADLKNALISYEKARNSLPENHKDLIKMESKIDEIKEKMRER